MIHKIFDWIDVPTISGVAIWISVTDLSYGLQITSLLIAIGYGLRKWYLMEKNKSNGKN